MEVNDARLLRLLEGTRTASSNVDDEGVGNLNMKQLDFLSAILCKIISDFMGYAELGAGRKHALACIAGDTRGVLALHWVELHGAAAFALAVFMEIRGGSSPRLCGKLPV